MLKTKEKQKIIEKIKTHETDTGSAEVQVAILSEEIEKLAKHLKKHPKDNHSRRGLLKLVSQRRKLLDYIKRENQTAYQKLISDLDLRK